MIQHQGAPTPSADISDAETTQSEKWLKKNIGFSKLPFQKFQQKLSEIWESHVCKPKMELENMVHRKGPLSTQSIPCL